MYNFEDEIKKFINTVESLEQSFMVVGPLIDVIKKSSQSKMNEFLEKYCILEDDGETYSIPGEHYRKYTKLDRRIEHFSNANVLLPRSFIVSLVSSFDAYLGNLIRVMFYTQPALLNSSQKSIEFSVLMGFESIDHAKEYIIEKEIETFLRDSHTDQFNWLEKKVSIELRKGLESWPYFAEITERRNLYVHSDGKVSTQYINICNKNQFPLDPNLKQGDTLHVNPKYVRNAYKTILEIGVKLGQVLWRKIKPSELERADSTLNDICFDLLLSEKYDLAIKLLEFATNTLKKHSSQERKLMFNINLAQAYKWKGEDEKARRILSQTDWSVLSYQFRLAHAVLTEQFNEAAKFMKKTDIDEVPLEAYNDWPLFKEFRETQEFKDSFFEIFKVEFKREDILKGETDDTNEQKHRGDKNNTLDVENKEPALPLV